VGSINEILYARHQNTNTSALWLHCALFTACIVAGAYTLYTPRAKTLLKASYVSSCSQKGMLTPGKGQQDVVSKILALTLCWKILHACAFSWLNLNLAACFRRQISPSCTQCVWMLSQIAPKTSLALLTSHQQDLGNFYIIVLKSELQSSI